jgi:hypothetical protein
MTSAISLEMMPETLRFRIGSYLEKNDQRAFKCASSVLAGKAEINPDRLSVQQIVHMVMACSDEINKDKDYYEKCEKNLKLIKKENPQSLLKLTPTAFLGGLTTWMSPQEIDSHVQRQFVALRQENMIISASEFEKIKHKYREPGRYKISGVILDRLWGALYLKDKIGDASKYKVPSYVIVVNDGVNFLSVQLTKTVYGRIPVIHSLASDEARLFVENIQPNKKVAGQGHFHLGDYGYVDFADPGNILEGPDGNYYIVDTEMSALEGCMTACRKALGNYPLKYTSMRCDTLNPWSKKIVKIKLND